MHTFRNTIYNSSISARFFGSYVSLKHMIYGRDSFPRWFAVREGRVFSTLPTGTVLASSPHEGLDEDEDVFFASSHVSFRSLGIDQDICDNLASRGFVRPSQVQSLAAEPILKGQNVVIAAETGSGKTLAYLAPLATLVLEVLHKEVQSSRSDSEEIGYDKAGETEFLEVPDEDIFGEDIDPKFLKRSEELASKGEGILGCKNDWTLHRTGVLVLCPNIQLCEQAHEVAKSIFANSVPESKQLLSSAVVSSRNPPPLDPPNFVFSTPGAIASLMEGAGPFYGGAWTHSGLPLWAQRVVFDESDLLFGGSYAKHLNHILDIFRSDDKERAAVRVCVELGIELEEYKALPRHVRRAAQFGGVQAMLDAGYKNETPEENFKNLSPGNIPKLRQYILAAATMPRVGDKTVGAEISSWFPNASWLTGKGLHRAQPKASHYWHQIKSDEDKVKKIIESIELDHKNYSERRTLVFCSDVISADSTAYALQEALKDRDSSFSELEIFRYHRNVSLEERKETLDRISREKNVVLVCTDAAARGIDVPDVGHVVQADFAASAVDFLHRIGRTARAGKSGRVTSLYTAENSVLAEALRETIEKGEQIEGAFSRKRSFRKKLKKYGKYVPRGQTGERKENN